MLDFTEITIEDKSTFNKYLSFFNTQISELTFTNLFMWRSFYKFRYTQILGHLCIISDPEHGDPFAFTPIGELNRGVLEEIVFLLKQYFNKRGWELRFNRVSENDLVLFEGLSNYKMKVTSDSNNSDYVYLTEDLINLKGKRYDGKRNHISKFKRLYEYEYVPITPELLAQCRRIAEDWCAERDCDKHKNFYCEKIANFELLDNYEKLGCKGALIKVNGKFKAFTVGEMLNDNTAVIHIEKANSSINGIYTFINQQFCEREWKDTTYINREQDLGIEGLRKAKLSYNPVMMIKKYSVSISDI